MIVDTHVHVVAEDRHTYPQLTDLPGAGSKPTVADLGQPEWPTLTAESLISMMDECGIARATLVQTYFTYHYDNSYCVDSALAYPDRFASVCVVDQLADGAAAELDKLVETRGVRGVRMMGARGAGALKDPRSFAVWERAEALGIPICIGAKLLEVPDLLVPLERFRNVKVALEHVWGLEIGDPPFAEYASLLEMAHFPNVYLKTAPNNSYAVREGNGTPREFFEMLIDRFGARRIMWGSNYPAHWHKYAGIKERLAVMREDFSFLSQEDQRWIFGETALSLWPSLG